MRKESCFKVNEYITLRLENGYTTIYVKGERFRHCMSLILNSPTNDIKNYDQINSIDEAVEVYKKHPFQNETIRENENNLNKRHTGSITPEQEFWEHCSNLQTWVEHEYDTTLLSSNMAFPLLKRLTEVGDPKASKMFKDEIVKRLLCGCITTTRFLVNSSYLKFFTEDELIGLLEKCNKNLQVISLINEKRAAFHILFLKLLELLGSQKVFPTEVKKKSKNADSEPTFFWGLDPRPLF